MYFFAKVLVTALVVAGVSELSRRSSLLAALLASLPLTSVLAFIWVYAETRDAQKVAILSYEVFWLVIPSLAFFLLLPVLLKAGLRFPLAMGLSCLGMAAGYAIFIWSRQYWR